MKSIKCLILVVLASAFLCGDVIAQSQDDRGFGRGRFLKRLRDDIFGPTKPNPASETRKKPTAATAKSRVPAANGKVPTPAPNKAHAARNPYAGQRQPTRVPATRPNYPRQPVLNPAPQTARQIAKPKDFGMTIDFNKNDELIVTNVIPGGNAAKAGVRPGDLVVEVGGAELTSIEEFESIAKVMSQGDQLEFKLQSRGNKPRTMHVDYGLAPEGDSEQISTTPNSANALSPTESENGLRSVLDSSTVQARSRTDQAPTPPQYRVNNRGNNRASNNTIANQQQQIQQLQQQLRRMQQTRQQPRQQTNQQQRQPINRGWQRHAVNRPRY